MRGQHAITTRQNASAARPLNPENFRQQGGLFLLLFDKDGTILKGIEEDKVMLYQQGLKTLHGYEMPDELNDNLLQLVGSDGTEARKLITQFIATQLGKSPDDDEVKEKFNQVLDYRAAMLLEKTINREYELTEEFKAIFNFLAENPYLLAKTAFAIVTSDNDARTEALMDNYTYSGWSFRDLFSVKITKDSRIADSGGSVRKIVSKPSPEPYLEAARMYGVKPEEMKDFCIIFEDSAKGLDSAKGSGAGLVYIVGDCEYPEAGKQGSPDQYIDRFSINHLMKYLGSRFMNNLADAFKKVDFSMILL